MVSGFPVYIMVDRDGKIVASQTGFNAGSGVGEAGLRSMVSLAGFGKAPDSITKSGKKKGGKKKGS